MHLRPYTVLIKLTTHKLIRQLSSSSFPPKLKGINLTTSFKKSPFSSSSSHIFSQHHVINHFSKTRFFTSSSGIRPIATSFGISLLAIGCITWDLQESCTNFEVDNIWETIKNYKISRLMQSSFTDILTNVPYHVNQTELRKNIEQMMNSKSMIVYSLLGVNLATFILWNCLPSGFMIRHFTSSLFNLSRGRIHTLITPMFSHKDFLHLSINMYLLYDIGKAVLGDELKSNINNSSILSAKAVIQQIQKLFLYDDDQYLSTRDFGFLYLGSGLVSSGISLWAQHLGGQNQAISLGASGAIFGLMSYYFLSNPEERRFFNLRNEDVFYLNMGYNAIAGCLTIASTRNTVGYFAHLGGCLFGYFYYHECKKKREML